MANYRIDLAYDGGRYKGWQRLGDDENTLQHKLETVLTRLLKEPVQVSGSGRTDAGVHARRQVVSFHAETRVSPEKLFDDLGRFLPADMAALSVAVVPDRFHARYNARWKTYRYRIWNAPVADPLERRSRYHVAEPLDLSKMRRAASALIGEHNFIGFSALKPGKKRTDRIMREINILADGPRVDIELIADGFLHHMSRLIAGTLIQIGCGNLPETTIETVLESGIRSQGGPIVPPQGLVLWDVDYGEVADVPLAGWEPGWKG